MTDTLTITLDMVGKIAKLRNGRLAIIKEVNEDSLLPVSANMSIDEKGETWEKKCSSWYMNGNWLSSGAKNGYDILYILKEEQS